MKLALCIAAFAAFSILFSIFVGKFLSFNDRQNLSKS